jgi:hypothetical protein
MDYRDFANQLSRERARQKIEKLDPLSPAEHTWIEQQVGMELSDDEAKILMKTAALEADFMRWMEGRKPS